ncbi:hypothetical protein [Rothia sp. 32237D007AR]
MKTAATDISDFIYIVLHIPFGDVSVAAVYSSYQKAEKYCQAYCEAEKSAAPWIICAPKRTRLYNLYPQTMGQMGAIREKISANPYSQEGVDSDVSPGEIGHDGYILLVEGSPNAPHILGVFPHHKLGGEADLYADEYLAVHPKQVIEFWDYTIDTIYFPLVEYDYEGQVFTNKIDGSIWESQDVRIYR